MFKQLKPQEYPDDEEDDDFENIDEHYGEEDGNQPIQTMNQNEIMNKSSYNNSMADQTKNSYVLNNSRS